MKEFRETKIRIISEAQSKAFQDAMFEEGARWSSSGKTFKQNLKFIFVKKDLMLTHEYDEILFEEHDYKEIQFPIPTLSDYRDEPMFAEFVAHVTLELLRGHDWKHLRSGILMIDLALSGGDHMMAISWVSARLTEKQYLEYLAELNEG